VETRERIVAAARVAFEERGLDGLSMRDIAKAVGVTPMAIYRHFDGKQSLIDMLVLDALEEWSAVVAAIAPAEPLEWLRRIGAAHLDFALIKPRRYEAAFLLHSEKARRYPDDFVAGLSPAGRLQLRLLEDLAAQRRLPGHAAVETLIANVGLSQGLITLYRAGRISGGEAEFREIYGRATERLIEALLAGGRE
jgi:AcrR family transcriptional regulator